jgi:hypothetical protein
MTIGTTTTSSGMKGFFRHEFQFPLDHRKREKVESHVRNFMSFDGYSNLDHAYYVRSLYCK